MLRKIVLTTALTVGLLVSSALPALAWDLIADKDGFGTTTLRTWTNRYNQGAWVVDHAGTRIAVRLRISCSSGATYNNSWVDRGSRFRQIVRGLGDEGRCNANLRVVPARSNVRIYLAAYARG